MIFAATFLAIAASFCLAAERGPRFEVTLPATRTVKPISGRLYVFLTSSGRSEPRFGPNWFRPEPFFRLDVQDFHAGTTRVIDASADGFPASLDHLPAGEYRAQAVLDHSFDDQDPGRGEGNFYSPVVAMKLDPAESFTCALALENIVQGRPFPDSPWVKEAAVRSALLSEFHGRDVRILATVALPHSYYEQPDRRFPVIYSIPGFGGRHDSAAARYARRSPAPGDGEEEFIEVVLSANCKWGHHVFADSATNGPRGESLVREMIPYIDTAYRTVAEPTARFVTGHSSGGWTSLWLQVTYPDVFGGVWSLSPDPVDFRDFQRIDLYADPPQNFYVEPNGDRRPLARRGTRPVLWFDSFTRMDDVLERGGQLRSFEAVFSPLGDDGLPRRVWDRETGQVDPEVAKAWEAYDIRLVLERNWKELEPQLRGKLHIVTGELDTFYLEGAVRLLGESLAQLGSDAEVTIVPGADHGSVVTSALRRRIRQQMSAAFREHHR